MGLNWQPHFMGEGYLIAKHNGYSIIRDLNWQGRPHSFIGGAAYEVMDREGDIHRFNSIKEMEAFISGE